MAFGQLHGSTDQINSGCSGDDRCAAAAPGRYTRVVACSTASWRSRGIPRGLSSWSARGTSSLFLQTACSYIVPHTREIWRRLLPQASPRSSEVRARENLPPWSPTVDLPVCSDHLADEKQGQRRGWARTPCSRPKRSPGSSMPRYLEPGPSSITARASLRLRSPSLFTGLIGELELRGAGRVTPAAGVVELLSETNSGLPE